MDMGTGAAAGIAHGGDLLPALDFIAAFLQKLIAMGITGDQSVAVVDDDGIAKQSFAADECYDPICSSQYRRSLLG